MKTERMKYFQLSKSTSNLTARCLGEEQHSYTCHDQGVFQQIQDDISGTETSQEQTSMIQEYVLLLCRFEAITMQDYESFCLLKLSSSRHKLLVGISF